MSVRESVLRSTQQVPGVELGGVSNPRMCVPGLLQRGTQGRSKSP